MYFDAAVVFVKTFLLLFRLALAILWSRSFINFNLKINSIILDSFLQSEAETRHQFYKILSQPLQTVCSISKKIGGEWLGAKGGCAWYDGAKFVCLDKWKRTIDKNQCLVYSFGIATDWSFEEILADMGCTVRTFDPTVDGIPSDVKTSKITFEKIGLSHFTGNTQVKICEISIFSIEYESILRTHQPIPNLKIQIFMNFLTNKNKSNQVLFFYCIFFSHKQSDLL